MSGETFSALLAPSLPSVRRFVQTRLRASDHAEGIVQQTLLRAFARRNQLRAHSKFKSWLRSIAMNEVRAFFRQDRGMISLDEFPKFDSRDGGPSPLARREQLERMGWLQTGMGKLCERDRTAIRLRDFDGMTLAETAVALNRSQSGMKSTHFRARRRLALILRGSSSSPRVRAR